MIAAARGLSTFVEQLLHIDADVNMMCNQKQWTAADFAAYFGYENIVELLHQEISGDSIEVPVGVSIIQ